MPIPEINTPLPNSDAYARAMRLFGSEVFFSGGEWNIHDEVYYRLKMLDAATPGIADDLYSAAYLASNYLVPPNDFERRARSAAVRTSFNGMLFGLMIAADVHGKNFPIVTSLEEGIAGTLADASQYFQIERARTLKLIELGDKGLKLIGAKAMRSLDRWAPELVSQLGEKGDKIVKTGFGIGIIGSQNVAAEIHGAADIQFGDTH